MFIYGKAGNGPVVVYVHGFQGEHPKFTASHDSSRLVKEKLGWVAGYNI